MLLVSRGTSSLADTSQNFGPQQIDCLLNFHGFSLARKHVRTVQFPLSQHAHPILAGDQSDQLDASGRQGGGSAAKTVLQTALKELPTRGLALLLLDVLLESVLVRLLDHDVDSAVGVELVEAGDFDLQTEGVDLPVDVELLVEAVHAAGRDLLGGNQHAGGRFSGEEEAVEGLADCAPAQRLELGGNFMLDDQGLIDDGFSAAGLAGSERLRNDGFLVVGVQQVLPVPFLQPLDRRLRLPLDHVGKGGLEILRVHAGVLVEQVVVGLDDLHLLLGDHLPQDHALPHFLHQVPQERTPLLLQLQRAGLRELLLHRAPALEQLRVAAAAEPQQRLGSLAGLPGASQLALEGVAETVGAHAVLETTPAAAAEEGARFLERTELVVELVTAAEGFLGEAGVGGARGLLAEGDEAEANILLREREELEGLGGRGRVDGPLLRVVVLESGRNLPPGDLALHDEGRVAVVGAGAQFETVVGGVGGGEVGEAGVGGGQAGGGGRAEGEVDAVAARVGVVGAGAAVLQLGGSQALLELQFVLFGRRLC